MRVLSALCLIALVGASSIARSEARTPHDRAVVLVERAQQEYEAARYSEAIGLLEEAWALEHDPTIVYNMGRAHEALGEERKALDHFRRYLSLAPEAQDRRAVESRIDFLERKLAERERRERAERERARHRTRTAPKQQRKVATPVDEGAKQNPWPWITAGAGVVALGVGTAFGIMANRSHDRAERATNGNDTDSDNSAARGLATGANVAFVAGGVLLASGLTWWVLSPKRSGEPTASAAFVSVGAGTASATTTF